MTNPAARRRVSAALGTAVLAVREAMGMIALDNLTAFFNAGTPPNAV